LRTAFLNSISSRWRAILRFRQDNRSRSLGPSVVLVDVVYIDEKPSMIHGRADHEAAISQCPT